MSLAKNRHNENSITPGILRASPNPMAVCPLVVLSEASDEFVRASIIGERSVGRWLISYEKEMATIKMCF